MLMDTAVILQLHMFTGTWFKTTLNIKIRSCHLNQTSGSRSLNSILLFRTFTQESNSCKTVRSFALETHRWIFFVLGAYFHISPSFVVTTLTYSRLQSFSGQWRCSKSHQYLQHPRYTRTYLTSSKLVTNSIQKQYRFTWKTLILCWCRINSWYRLHTD